MENSLGFLYSTLEQDEGGYTYTKQSTAENPLRTSSYTIYVDLPDTEEMLLVHGYLGSYDRVSRPVAQYLRSLEARRPPKPLYGVWKDTVTPTDQVVPPSDETIKLLKQRGYLTRKTVKQEESFFLEFAKNIHKKNVRSFPSYIIMPTYNCNLRCPYCFQDHMRTDPNLRQLLGTMSRRRVDLMLKAIVRIEEMHEVKMGADVKRPFTLFGGEPLLRKSRDIIEYIMNGIFSLGSANVNAISNATELDAFEDLLGPDLINRIQVTLDGPPEEHDQRRIYPDGSGSFKKIARNIDMALERQVQISVRLNLDRNNINDLPQLIQTVMHYGWHEHKNFSIYAAPIRGEKKAKELMNAWELTQELESLKKDHPDISIVGRPDDGLRNKVKQMFSEPGKHVFSLKPVFCSAHNRMYIFDSFGDIYACWEKTGDARIRIGYVTDEGDVHLNAPPTIQWRTRTVASNPVCGKCRYALHCGGGCAVLAEGRTGKLHSNFCDGFASRFRSVLAEGYANSGKQI